MSNNYYSITFPLEGSKLEFRIFYKLNGNKGVEPLVGGIPNGSLTKKAKIYSLDMELVYIKNQFANGEGVETPSWPTVNALIEEFSTVVLQAFKPLLGKNVQVTGMEFTSSSSTSIFVSLYEFGSSTRVAASPETTLFFVLQPVRKRASYRLYVRGASQDFLKHPLGEAELSAVEAFERVFTSVISMFNGQLELQYVRNNEPPISCVFRGPVRFEQRTQEQAKRQASSRIRQPRKAVGKVRVA